MVGDAPRRGSHLLQAAQARRGLARVEHLAEGAGDPIDMGAREGGDATQALHEVERRAFAGEQRPRQAGDAGEGRGGLHRAAGGLQDFERIDAAAQAVHGLKQLDARHHHRLAGEKGARGLERAGHGQFTGDVARADVLGEGSADGVHHVRVRAVEPHRYAPRTASDAWLFSSWAS